MLSTKEIFLDYTLAELYACSNEILMSKENNLYDITIKLIHNKILESICVYDFYVYLYSCKKFDINNLENKWKELCLLYNIDYKKNKWLTDFNSISNPQNILSYTIAYLLSLKFTSKNYNDYKELLKKEISLEEIINI